MPTPAIVRLKRPKARGRSVQLQQFVLRVTMADISPFIWRLVRVPDKYTLHQFHRVLQISFSRLDCHLYAFQIGARQFEAPDSDSGAEDASAIALAALDLSRGSRFTYVYDFGDGWEHDIAVEAVLPMPSENGPDWSPRLLAGERAAPPEDSGGVPGFMEVVAALRDPANPRHKEIREWVGTAYEPDRFDPWAVDHALALAVAWGAI